MNVSELLKDLSRKLSDPNSELLTSADWNDDLLDLTSDAIVACTEILNKAAKDAEVIEATKTVDAPNYEVLESELSAAASVIDELELSGEEKYVKLASVFDELLLTICSNKDEIARIKKAKDDELEKLRMKFRAERGEVIYPTKVERETKQAAEAAEAIAKSIKAYRPMEYALSTRYSPDMPGVSLVRIADGVYQCPVTKKLYDFNSGYKLDNGDEVPGSSVAEQTNIFTSNTPNHMAFSTRSEALNADK